MMAKAENHGRGFLRFCFSLDCSGLSRLEKHQPALLSLVTPASPTYLKAVLLGADHGLYREGELLGIPDVGDGVAHKGGKDLLGLDVRGAVPLKDLCRVEALP